MSSTEILGVNELDAAVATKFPTYNEGRRQTEGQLTRALSATVSSPPGGEEEGDTYIIPVGASGDWTGRDNEVAHFWNGRYDYYPPFEGMKLQVVDDQVQTYAYDGTNWKVQSAGNQPFVTVVSSVGGVLTLNIDRLDPFPYFVTTLTENITSVVVTGGQDIGRPTQWWLEVTADGVSSITWDPVYRWDNDTPPAQSVTPGNVDVYRFFSWNGYADILSHSLTQNA